MVIYSNQTFSIIALLLELFFFRQLLAYLMVPIMQKEIDTFVNVVWNTHRIRAQKDTFLPAGIPNHIFSFPEQYGVEECGMVLPVLDTMFTYF